MNRTIYVRHSAMLNGIDTKPAITITDALLNRIADQKRLPKHSVDWPRAWGKHIKMNLGVTFYKKVKQSTLFQSQLYTLLQDSFKMRETGITTETRLRFNILLTVHHIMILGKWPTWRTIPFYVFIFIFNFLHVSSTSCSSSGETNCVNTTSGSCQSVSVAVSCAGWKWTSDI